jgi:hypothetical protein
MDLTPEQEEQRQKTLAFIAKQEAYWAAHPDEMQAFWDRLDRDEAAYAACDHDWQVDEHDSRWAYCTRCGWAAFYLQPGEA